MAMPNPCRHELLHLLPALLGEVGILVVPRLVQLLLRLACDVVVALTVAHQVHDLQRVAFIQY